MKHVFALFNFALLFLLSGCVIKPDEAEHERTLMERTGRDLGYATTAEAAPPRDLPEVPQPATWQAVLQRAFLANGDLEGAFHEWAMAVHRIDQAGTYPTQPLELGFDYMFSSEQMKSFNRTTVSIGLMDASALPNETYQSAVVAWRDAQAAGERFRVAKFDLQARVLQAWADYRLQVERVRIQEQNLSLLRLVATTAASRVRAGAAQQEQLRADVAARLAENQLATTRSELLQQRARLNGLLKRPADAPLEVDVGVGQQRSVAANDDTLLAAGVANNPTLAALGRERQARDAAVSRARLEYLPEVNPFAAFTGSISQTIGGSIALPTQLPRIRAMIDEARADLRRVEATAAQARADRAAEFLVALLAMRDAERRARLFETDVLPLAQRTVELARQGYASGSVTYLDLIDAQRTDLDVRLMVAEARTTRDRMLAELERLAGADVETLGRDTGLTSPTTQATAGGNDDD